MKTTATTININQVKVVKILTAMVVLFMFAYLYFVNSAAFAAASFERINDQIVESQSEIGELELTFIEKNRSIDKDMASEYGLVLAQQSDMTFTRRNESTKLTLNE